MYASQAVTHLDQLRVADICGWSPAHQAGQPTEAGQLPNRYNHDENSLFVVEKCEENAQTSVLDRVLRCYQHSN